MSDIWEEAGVRAERAEHKPGMTPYRRGLKDLFVEPLTRVIEAKLQDKSHLPHGRLGTLLQAVEPRTLALMALEAVIPATDRPLRVKTFEARIKERIGEIFYANNRLREPRAREILKGKLRRPRGESIKDWQSRLRRRRSKIWQSLLAPVSRRDLIHAGAWLLQCVMDAEIVVFRGRYLLPTSKYTEDIGRLRRFIIRSNVRLLPTKTPPPWTGPEIYHCGLKIQLLSHWNPDHHARMAENFQSERFQRRHLAALHTLESVPQQIDGWTLDLVRRHAKKVKSYDDNDRRLADENQIDAEIKTAERLMLRGVFRNKYGLDFRGRIYAKEGFNFAQHDRIRSLVRFRDGAVLGGDGLRWLKIHAANTYGQDKISYDDRVKWVEQRPDSIARVAADPEASFGFWSSADKPFAFAAACRELVNALNNPGFVTTLPLPFDHTASGIQHLALLGLDERARPRST
jgi:DNA-dependent RNA polymerase